MIIAYYKVSAIAGYNSYIIPVKVSDTTPQVTKLQAMMELDKCADSARAKSWWPSSYHSYIKQTACCTLLWQPCVTETFRQDVDTRRNNYHDCTQKQYVEMRADQCEYHR